MRLPAYDKSVLIPRILNYIFPSSCPSCNNHTDSIVFAPLCGNCWGKIKKFTGPSCRICSTPLSSEYADICSECVSAYPPFSGVRSYGLYEGVLAEAISLFKFYRIRRLYRPLGSFLLEYDISGTDAIIPVPLSANGLRERGFNQSLLLAKFLSDKSGIPLVMNGLIKIKETPPQIGLSAKQRSANLKKAFKAGGDFKGMRLLLVDDVMTTGATVKECSKQLLKAGAEDVAVLTLARAGER